MNKVSQEEGKKRKGKRARKMERRVRGKGQAYAEIDREQKREDTRKRQGVRQRA